MANSTIIVSITTDIQVRLNEDITGTTLTEEQRERAIDAALSPIPQKVDVFIDGCNIDPAEVFFDCTDSDVVSVSLEIDIPKE